MLRHRAVHEEVFGEAATIVQRQQEIGVSSATVFDSLCRADDWRRWAGLDVTWTSKEPHGVGATRWVRPSQLKLPSSVGAVHERFFVWEDGRRLAFHAERSPIPVPVFAEDYVVTDVADGGSELRWTLALDGGLSPVREAVGDRLGSMFSRALTNLARMLEQRGA